MPASNTKTVVFPAKGSSNKGTETQPLAISDNVQWSSPVLAKPRDATLPTSGGQKARVTLVLDGDSANLKTEKGGDLVCRLDKIDAPETAKRNKAAQAYGDKSKQNLKSLIDNKNVNVWVSTARDEYGRSLCQIEIDGVDASLKQLQDGAAWLYKKYGNHPLYNQAQANARYNQSGLFADREAIHPREFKH